MARRRPRTTRTLVPYEFDPDAPTSYENRDGYAHQRKATCHYWTVHLHVEDEFTATHAAVTIGQHGMNVVPLTGHYTTTSWSVWGEDPGDNNDWSLVIYFTTERSGDLQTAYQRGKHLAALVGLDDDATFVVSTAGDWAEQIRPEEGDPISYLDEPEVTCDGCRKTSESGWGDNPYCLDCSPPDEICYEHRRTFVGTCPLHGDDDLLAVARAVGVVDE